MEFLLFERCPTEGRISCVQTNSESVLVLPTAAKSGAKRSMLTEGYDVLLTLVHKGQHSELRSVEQFNKLLGALDKTAVLTLQVRRGESTAFVTVTGLADKG